MCVAASVPAVTGIVSSSTSTHTLINVIHGTGGFKPFPVPSLLYVVIILFFVSFHYTSGMDACSKEKKQNNKKNPTCLALHPNFCARVGNN